MAVDLQVHQALLQEVLQVLQVLQALLQVALPAVALQDPQVLQEVVVFQL
jgi:hypothetical protein